MAAHIERGTPLMNGTAEHPVIRAEDLSARYGHVPVLHSISIEARRGELVCFAGPNGSGKSTLFYLLANLAPPELRKTAGNVFIGETPAARISRKEFAKRVGFVQQKELFVWPFPVEEAILAGRYARLPPGGAYSAGDRRVAREKADMLGLSHLLDRPVNQLSGGEFRRTVTARALAQEPDILILDEPVSGLDIRQQHILMRTVRDLTRTGITALVSLHDLNLSALYADRIILISGGRIRASGNARDIFRPELLSGIYGMKIGIFTHPTAGVPQLFADGDSLSRP